MIDFSLSSEQQAIVAKYRDFTQRWIIPNRMKYDALAEFPWEIIKASYDEGIINGPIPKEYGGNGYDQVGSALQSEELGAGCIGIGICIDANTLALTPLLLSGSDAQKKKFFGRIKEEKGVAAYCLTEPNAGSDVQAISSYAEKKGDKYILNGHKRFITNGEVASFHTVFAITDPEKGSRSLSAFIVPLDLQGIEIVSRLDKMGQKASVQNEIKYHDVEVPAENLLGEEGRGFLIAMKTFDRTRTGVAALSIGVARSAYEHAKDWAQKRIQFGKPIAANQAIGFLLADMATEIEAARTLTWYAAWAHDAGQRAASKLAAMSKMYASDIAMKVTTDAVQVMGGEGYSREHPVEKMMRDAKLCQIYEGTNQVQRIVISKSILKE
ncbi:MAG: acyl-CoA dehydrogenase family protein [Bacteroidales bacterium]|nr:acyl-CoA dehydrogenase family protein [Lentimicrobiaceae bacterium]MDD5695968.1 acyl-CoA dehydrogenase family protein [Bacteroidales bacterium]